MAGIPSEIPAGGSPTTWRQRFRADVLAGLLVFLLALPLCLAISRASGFPPVAGLLTAIIGGLVVTLLGGSELAIKGPAAGLLVIAAGATEELGQGDALLGYKLALAAIVLAGVLQVLFGLLRLGILGNFFPSAVMRGMMAAIGLNIILRQLFVLTGTQPAGSSPWQLLLGLPGAFTHLHAGVFAIGLLSLGLLWGLPALRLPALPPTTGPLLVLLISLPLAHWLGIGAAHTGLLPGASAATGAALPARLPASLSEVVTFPDFAQLFTATSLKYTATFALVGSLELLLTTRAIDLLDPLRRRADLDRELLAVGAGNVLAGALGGLPMISEIVRSSANVAGGARTRWAGFVQGLLLLLVVALAPGLLARIPLAALAAILIHIGVRLAAPREFTRMFRIGGEQLLIFLVTIGGILGTNLLLGIGAGIVAKLLVHLLRGLPLRSVFRARTELLTLSDGGLLVKVHGAAVFSNYISLLGQLTPLPRGRHIIIDLSDTRLVDHTVLENLDRFCADYAHGGGLAELSGLQRHKPVSAYPTAARVREEAVSLASA